MLQFYSFIHNIWLRFLDFVYRKVYILTKCFNRKGYSVLMLHDISDSNYKYSISVNELEKLIQKVGHDGFISMDSFYKHLLENAINDKVILTFDDIFESVYLNAYPILKKYSIPFTVFVCTDFIDKKGYISTEQLRELANEPLCTIGSHSSHHVKHRNYDSSTVKEWLANSKELLEKITKREVKYMAFPYGSKFACSSTNLKDAFNCGFNLVFSTTPNKVYTNKVLRGFCPRINYSGKWE